MALFDRGAHGRVGGQRLGRRHRGARQVVQQRDVDERVEPLLQGQHAVHPQRRDLRAPAPTQPPISLGAQRRLTCTRGHDVTSLERSARTVGMLRRLASASACRASGVSRSYENWVAGKPNRRWYASSHCRASRAVRTGSSVGGGRAHTGSSSSTTASGASRLSACMRRDHQTWTCDGALTEAAGPCQCGQPTRCCHA
jgi:hypothetical protein